jgi:hypothetical protein
VDYNLYQAKETGKNRVVYKWWLFFDVQKKTY